MNKGASSVQSPASLRRTVSINVKVFDLNSIVLLEQKLCDLYLMNQTIAIA